MKEILEKLLAREDRIKEKRIVAGFDGFIDTIAKPLKRSGNEGEPPLYFKTIEEFGTHIAGQGHKSASIEMDVIERRMGGNMPNFARGIAPLGVQLSCIGMLSDAAGNREPLFRDLRGHSFAPAGTATALEFDDGKLFLAPRYVPGSLPSMMSYADLLSGADCIACLNWGELSFATLLWRDLFKTCRAIRSKVPFFFFDLSDFSRRSDDEIREALSLIGSFSSLGTTVLSLNRNEAMLMADRIIPEKKDDSSAIARALGQGYSIGEIIIHSHEDARVCTGNETYEAKTSPIAAPKISTGAGDTFNAAYVFALVMGFSPEERLRFANRYAHRYVSQGTVSGLRDLYKLL
jgi:sugar/nucleoside kinase (ribokinase family)